MWLFSLTDIPGSVESISSLDEGKGQVKVVVTANATGKQGLGATKIVHFTLPDSTPDSKLFQLAPSIFSSPTLYIFILC